MSKKMIQNSICVNENKEGKFDLMICRYYLHVKKKKT